MTLWTVAHQAPLSMGFPRQEYQSVLSFPSPGDLPDPGMPCISCTGRWVLDSLPLSHHRSPCIQWESFKSHVDMKCPFFFFSWSGLSSVSEHFWYPWPTHWMLVCPRYYNNKSTPTRSPKCPPAGDAIAFTGSQYWKGTWVEWSFPDFGAKGPSEQKHSSYRHVLSPKGTGVRKPSPCPL